MRLLLFVCFGLFFFFTPFMRGLFFDKDFYALQIGLYVIFLLTFLFLALKKELPRILYPFVLIVFPIILGFSYFHAATPLGAINEILRWTAYCCYFFLVCYICMERNYKQLVYYIVLITGFTIAVFSLCGYTGMIDFPDIVVADRLAGTLQYPNTFAVLMAALWLFSLNQLSNKDLNKVEFYLLGVVVIPVFVSFLLAESRAALLFIPLVWIIGLFMHSLKKQLVYLIISLVSIMISCILYFISPIKSGWLLGYVAAGVIVFVSSLIAIRKLSNHYMRTALFKKLESSKMSRFGLPIIIAICTCLVILDFVFHGIVYSILPERVQSISLNSDTFTERMVMAKDALRASKDSLLVGFGGQGWSVLFTDYQSLPYQANNIHNGYLEWLINSGVIGLLVFIGIFVFLIIKMMKKRSSKERTPMQMSVFLAVLMIFIHSSVDFNFSFGTVWFVLLTLLALGLPPNESGKNTRTPTILIQLTEGLLISFVLLSLTISYRFFMSNQLFSQTVDPESVNSKQGLLTKSVQYNPYDIEKWNALGMSLLADKDSGSNEAAGKIAQKIVSLEGSNSTATLYAVNLFEKTGMKLSAIRYLNRAIELDKFNILVREKDIQLTTEMALQQLNQREKANSIKLAKVVIAQYDKIELDVKELQRKLPSDRFNGRKFHSSENIKYFTALSYFIMGNYGDVSKLANPLLSTKNNQIKSKAAALVFVANELNNSDNNEIISRKIKNDLEFQSNVKELKELASVGKTN
ncbi:O-antigen ligase family protein [Neobacillus sp. OS1-2]|uniref:O-antigen ligase family protein n=1 Tax=Neobacillus sp. OS1-2 TaxID=3070680 RepID=UPI0027DF18C3|nr:O-antigen ligase family protein [Neobacillus sp. OS1-2]WML41219.1 O-antigen ligase family protein [Neobacillus sp. OS1-2]